MSSDFYLVVNPYAQLIGVSASDVDNITPLSTIKDKLDAIGYDSEIHTGKFTTANIDTYLNTEANNVFVSISHGGRYTGENFVGSYISLTDSKNSGVYYTSYDSINFLDLSNMKLIVFIGCETGNGGENAQNLPAVSVERGATTAIGFDGEIGSEKANEWSIAFFVLLESGWTVKDACEALGEMPIYANKGLASYVICGDKNTTLN